MKLTKMLIPVVSVLANFTKVVDNLGDYALSEHAKSVELFNMKKDCKLTCQGPMVPIGTTCINKA